MEKIQTLLIILLGLGVFVWRMVQKAREMAARESRERPALPKAPGLPPTSFQDLLEQMKSQNKAGNQPQPATSQPTTPAGRPLPREQAAPVARSLERTEVDPRSLETMPTARSLETPTRTPRLAASMPRTTALPTREDYWTRQASHSTDEARQDARRRVQAMLRSPADLRAAFVLSEILKPKYE
ncbi:hypothetical protein GCM10011375_32400 [Hymenobacter qilianensis]|uniref:Uncharacterized protein n=2 Tax=Hymenobacter qilianensis TaxID=1385715 RepID=A0A7H0GT60_9BACT|nr:hypothetical protein [Hymenobacter qilianensis]QNP51476.1 hypothetical protein H9L05_15820 [Hymenobacter qilianensis]GGF74860.1 hypothetical protein GCM10011375_32400 [Hymenobacter qilianensis]